MQRDPYGYQTNQKNYLLAAKAYESTRIDFIQQINSVNLNINLDLIDKVGSFFSGEIVLIFIDFL